MKLTPEHTEAVTEWARRNGIGSGHQQISVCQVCGTPRWRSSDSSRPFGVSIGDHSPSECEPCGYVMQRHPELFEWIMRVLAFRDAGRAALREGGHDR